MRPSCAAACARRRMGSRPRRFTSILARSIPACWTRSKGLPASTAPSCRLSPTRTRRWISARFASRTSLALSSFGTIEASSSTRTWSASALRASPSREAFPGSCRSLPHWARKRAMVIERMPVSRSSIWTSVFCTASPSTCLPSSRSSWATGFITLLLPAPAMPWIATIRSRDESTRLAAFSCPSLSEIP